MANEIFDLVVIGAASHPSRRIAARCSSGCGVVLSSKVSAHEWRAPAAGACNSRDAGSGKPDGEPRGVLQYRKPDPRLMTPVSDRRE